MKSLGPLCAFLLLPSMLSAFEVPRVFIEDYTIPDFDADTVYQGFQTVYAYGEDPEFNTAALEFFVDMGWTVDEEAGIVFSNEHVVTAVEVDGSNRMVRMENRHTGADGSNDGNILVTTWNAGGKPILEISTDIDDPSNIDSTIYTWSRANCPDVRTTYYDAASEKVEWEVDAQGRCLTGAISEYEEMGGTWTPTRTTARTWSAEGPIQELSLGSDEDTLEIHRIRYAGAGKPVADSIWSEEGGELVMVQSCANTLEGGAFRGRTCTSVNGYYTMAYEMSPHGATGVTYRPAKNRLPVEARAMPGRVVFRNRGSAPVALDVRTVGGARLGVFALEAGSATAVPTVAGTIVWKATSAAGTRSGMVHAIR